MSITIIIINFNEKHLTSLCLQSLQRQTSKDFGTIVIENGSKESERVSGEWFKTVVLNRNYGFPFAVNLGAKMASSDWVLILNNDCELAPDFFEEMEKAVEKNTESKVFSPKIYQKFVSAKAGNQSLDSRRSLPHTELRGGNDKTLYSCGDDIDEKGLARNIGRGEIDKGQYDNVKNVPLATFACILIKKEILERFPLDETYFGYYEDVDFGLRLQKAKITIHFVPQAVCFHLGEASFSKLNNLDNEIRQFSNLSLTVIKHFSVRNIVRHYLLFNLKTFRYYFLMKKKWKFLVIEKEIFRKIISKILCNLPNYFNNN